MWEAVPWIAGTFVIAFYLGMAHPGADWWKVGLTLIVYLACLSLAALAVDLTRYVFLEQQ